MGMKSFLKGMLFLICASMFVGTMFANPLRKSQTYYLDASGGNDNMAGTSRRTAWKSLGKINATAFLPGDSILFKAGEKWMGCIRFKGAGKSGAPIAVAAYGKGNKPVLDGNGARQPVILLENTEYWEISDLEITNASDSIGYRQGILVKADEDGLKSHLRFRNLFIHNIMGDYSFEMKGKNTGGIGIIGGVNTRFNDIIIENCDIGNINRVGIFTNLTDSRNAVRGKRPITGLIIRGNRIHHCAGDGLIVRYADRPLIEYNIAYENHNAPEELVKHGVALWCRSTDDAIFQYNEVYNTKGKMDGQAFDADLDAYRTLVQYNRSHHNEGGFMLVYGSSSETIVRYNVSIADGMLGGHIFDFPVWTKPRGSGAFHNNTIIIPKNITAVIADEALPTAQFYDNLFYNMGKGGLSIPSENTTATFRNNSYFGYDKAHISDPRPTFIEEFED